MRFEKSVGGVIFRSGKVLLLKYKGGSGFYWDFPKGHVEEGESEVDTLLREVREETGLKSVKVLNGFREVVNYYFRRGGELVSKVVVFYACTTDEVRVIISSEHYGYKWVSVGDALNWITYDSSKKLFEKAVRFLNDSNVYK